jgi:hypothetical protein
MISHIAFQDISCLRSEEYKAKAAGRQLTSIARYFAPDELTVAFENLSWQV